MAIFYTDSASISNLSVVGSLNISGSFNGTSSFSLTSSLSISSSYALTSSLSTSASFSLTSSTSTNSSFASTASQATSASFASTASQATSASFSLTSSTSTSSSFANTTSQAISASFSLTSSTSVSSSFASTASFIPNIMNLINTGSLATTGSNTFVGNQTITGSLILTNNLTVLGSSSIVYITSSQLDVATNILYLNTSNPGLRYGGIAVVDSGSSPKTSGSILFDSLKNQWIFVHQGTFGGVITSSVFIQGPQTFNDLGNEITLLPNRLTKGFTGDLGEHITSSNILDTGQLVSINSNTEITGSLIITNGVTASLLGTSSWAANAQTSSLSATSSIALTASFVNPLNQTVIITGSLIVITGSSIELQVLNTGVRIGNLITDTHTLTGSLNISGSLNSPSTTGSLLGTSSYASQALSSSFAATASLLLGSVTSASYAATASLAPLYTPLSTFTNYTASITSSFYGQLLSRMAGNIMF